MKTEDKPIILQESAEPGVIDQKMLVALIIDQGPKKEAGRLFVEDGINLEEVTEIRIEFLNILNIDHLWLMPNLVKLKLSNNKIERIVNLDVLINLKELDLSFNHIETMENLNHLKCLEILLLYENQISLIQGIDDLNELTIFSIGNNNIADWHHVMYLRKFKKLRSLNVSGNSCMEKEGYLNYLIAFIPQLIYLQYKMITDRERQAAADEHYRIISNLLEEEAKEQEKLDKQAAFEENVALLSISYVEYLDDDYLFNKMFEKDKEGNDFLTLSEDARSAYAEYKVKFMELCKDLYELGLAEQIRRSNEIKMFEDLVTKGEDDIQKDSQMMMDEIMDRKAEILADVKALMQSMTEELETEVLEEKLDKARQLSEEFSDLVARTWTKLMHKEVILHDQMEDINEVFKQHMTDMVGSFLEAAQNIFSLMRNLEAEYTDNIAGIASVVMNTSQATEDSKMSPSVTDIIGDKDILNNNLAASHDLHLQIIDGREDRLTSRLNGWLEGKIEKLAENESNRNRQKILEISHFLECQREEFDALQLQQPLYVNTDDPDIAAVLEQ
ncbi:dynein regulatory complex subunit 3 [Neodiprion pinetum]|uniref:Dynein axonemal assembly factor 1 homolog n=1 Tax=Neodiprion lecontei TaxID=441921 RepID=A0A6J0C785_NEOLC|nr:dynein regulatory complex subunit 3 [Neodiprion lecontei]XP_046480330.1 dynein regulatory complex subunit 3 [Neodiprion pinetum]XP_046480331.1 dynein regulatory complex subunit 3 [Neodiprion pinetum]XP_046480332.1 dynein regulatory complex subunit 3 [Neodiprion pinetum]XP_046594914.1 dynein regulatory complex subunit 3 [Neodiprion lecontei]XP_046594915.1 dynein regulatory complex subunit 3 [Neodiprion lecontei]